MRVVSFVDRLEFDFLGNIYKSAIALGDVDNDGDNELAVGNINGEVAIFKGRCKEPWHTAPAYGMVASIVVGDILNERKNFLVTISGEGWCNVFVVPKDVEFQGSKREGPQKDDTSQHCSSSPGTTTDGKRLQPYHTQRLMANTKMALLADLDCFTRSYLPDGDGQIELVIAMTDRVVRSYKWTKLAQFSSTKSGGKLVAQNKWEFANQIGSVTLNSNGDGTNSLMIAQPGGTYAQLNCYPSATDGEAGSTREPLEYHPLSSTKMRNPNVSTEIVGGIQRLDGDTTKPTLYAVATLDGTLMLLDKESIIWSIQVDHQPFVLTKMDLTGDNGDEVVACSWDGQTYIININQQSLRFQFEEPVCTFVAGNYAFSPGNNIPCLVYVTFNNCIYIYYNIRVPQISTSSLVSIVDAKPEFAMLFSKLKLKKLNPQELSELCRWLLYGFPCSNRHAFAD